MLLLKKIYSVQSLFKTHELKQRKMSNFLIMNTTLNGQISDFFNNDYLNINESREQAGLRSKCTDYKPSKKTR